MREQPSLQVHVSEVGAPHLVDPSRLEASARRLYGDSFDRLWGELVPVPEENVDVVGDDVLGLECFPSTGHASHHVSMLHEDGTLYAGDSMGVRIAPGSFVLPPTPPPDIDLEAWEQTIAATERRAPARLALTHFGVFEDVEEHLARLRETLLRWGERVGHGMDQETFVAAARADCLASDPDAGRRLRPARRRPGSASSGSSGTGASAAKPPLSLARLAPLRRRELPPPLLRPRRLLRRLGDGPVALAFAVLDLGGSATDLGIVLAIAILPQVFFLLVGGVVADRMPRHLVMVGSNLLAGAAQTVAAVLLLTGNAQIWQLAVIALVRAVATSFFFPAQQGS